MNNTIDLDRTICQVCRSGAVPANALCVKCGSSDINRRHRIAGEEWNNYGMERERSTEYVEATRYAVTAKLECITHHCRSCHYDWETPTADTSSGNSLPAVRVSRRHRNHKTT